MEKRIIEIEKRIAFQDVLLDELNSVVIEQQKSIDALEQKLVVLRDQVQAGSIPQNPQEELPPPHY